MDDRSSEVVTRRPLGRAGWWSAVGGLVVVMLALTGCGAQARPAPADETSTGGVIRGRYTMILRQDGQEFRQEYEVLADGDRRTRINYFGEPETDWEKRTDGNWTVWDGRFLLDHNPDGDPAYTRTQATADGRTPVYVLTEGSAQFRKACPSARRAGTHILLRRTAVRYACAASTEDGAMMEPHELSLDQASGLLLRDAAETLTIEAGAIEFNVTADAGTFSTELPAGEQDASRPRVEDVRVPRVGGGELALADFPPPLVIVTGDAAGIHRMVARLQPLTQNGARPQVIGLLIAIPSADWTGSLLNPNDAASFAEQASQAAGRFPVPVGVDIKGAAGYQIVQAAGLDAGLPNPTAVGFVASDGTLALEQVVTDQATDDELRERIDALL